MDVNTWLKSIKVEQNKHWKLNFRISCEYIHCLHSALGIETRMVGGGPLVYRTRSSRWGNSGMIPQFCAVRARPDACNCFFLTPFCYNI